MSFMFSPNQIKSAAISILLLAQKQIKSQKYAWNSSQFTVKLYYLQSDIKNIFFKYAKHKAHFKNPPFFRLSQNLIFWLTPIKISWRSSMDSIEKQNFSMVTDG